MVALLVVLGTLIFIILSGIVAYKALGKSTKIHPILFGWIWFNIWIAIYETYIVLYRSRMRQYEDSCEKRKFWSRGDGAAIGDSFWLRAWAEYACFADKRYFDPNNLVFWIELGNAIIVGVLVLLLIMGWNTAVLYMLLIQAYHCFIYFLTWWKENRTDNNISVEGEKKYMYLLLSAVWLILPVVVIFVLLK